MTRMLARTLALAVACVTVAAVSPRPARGQGATQQGAGQPTISAVAAQLGVKIQPNDDALDIGSSFTGMLEVPDKLAEFGIKGMHANARVTVTRVAPDKVRVEADEMDPVAQRGAATLKLVKGELTKPKS